MTGRGRGRGRGRPLNWAESTNQSVGQKAPQIPRSQPRWGSSTTAELGSSAIPTYDPAGNQKEQNPMESFVNTSIDANQTAILAATATDQFADLEIKGIEPGTGRRKTLDKTWAVQDKEEEKLSSSDSTASPLETFRFASEGSSNVQKIIAASAISIRTREQVENAENKDERRGKEIRLNVNHFKIKIKAPQLWQYKLAFLSSDRGPTLKTHDEKRAVFQAFVDQFVKTPDHDQSGFETTMLTPKTSGGGIGMVYDGDGLAYYYKDLSSMPFWAANLQRGNWNLALADVINTNDQFKSAQSRPYGAGWKYWEAEAQAANRSMLPDTEKQREFARVEVEFSPPGYKKACRYPMIITETSFFTAAEIESVASGNSKNQAIIQAIDVILRYAAAKKHRISGTTIFPVPATNERTNYLGEGRDIWYGYTQSVRQTGWKTLTLNIDAKTSAFYRKCAIIDFACEVFKCNHQNIQSGLNIEKSNEKNVKILEKHLKGYMFETTYNNIEYKIGGLHHQDSTSATFERDGVNVSVADYFKEVLDKPIQFPRLPLVRVGSSKSKRMKLFPMEFCALLGAQKAKELGDRQIADLIKKAGKTSDQMMTHVQQIAGKAINACKEVCEEYGLEIGNRMGEVGGTIISPPKLEFGQGNVAEASDRNGGGNFAFSGKSFYKASEIGSMVIAAMPTSQVVGRDCQALAKSLCQHGQMLGMKISSNIDIRQFKNLDAFDDFIKNTNCNLLICILGKKNDPDYSYVKKSAELEYGVMTQCLTDKTVKGKNNQGPDAMTATNILLKINQKMDGLNFRTDKAIRPMIFSRPMMVMGASLSHSMHGGVSVAALAASLDSGAVLYSASVAVQDRTHLIIELAQFVENALKQFFAATNGKKPEKIVYYRDGIGEGQYDDVVKYELTQIREACNGMQEGYTPGVTMISVQRRHHVKFFCKNENEGVGRAKNVPAGTVIDHGVVSENYYDFYLYAHAGIMGTSRPAHYLLLHDDNDLSGQSLQIMSYFLCHAYARCTRTVAMPICIYYSQLIAQRGRHWLKRLGYDDSETLSTCSGGSGGTQREKERREKAVAGLKMHSKIQSRMFFC